MCIEYLCLCVYVLATLTSITHTILLEINMYRLQAGAIPAGYVQFNAMQIALNTI